MPASPFLVSGLTNPPLDVSIQVLVSRHASEARPSSSNTPLLLLVLPAPTPPRRRRWQPFSIALVPRSSRHLQRAARGAASLQKDGQRHSASRLALHATHIRDVPYLQLPRMPKFASYVTLPFSCSLLQMPHPSLASSGNLHNYCFFASDDDSPQGHPRGTSPAQSRRQAVGDPAPPDSPPSQTPDALSTGSYVFRSAKPISDVFLALLRHPPTFPPAPPQTPSTALAIQASMPTRFAPRILLTAPRSQTTRRCGCSPRAAEGRQRKRLPHLRLLRRRTRMGSVRRSH